MTDPEKPIKQGYLWLPPKSTFLLVSKPWQKKFCRLYCASKQGIERLEIFENEDDLKNSTIPIITLESCIKISEDVQKNQANVFSMITKTTTLHFSAANKDEMNDWILAFQTVAFGDNVSRQMIQEDNELYCSSGDTGVFSVKLIKSDASERCGFESGTYVLILKPEALELRDSLDNTILCTWPYRQIRRYGSDRRSGRFTFEAGRKCSTGEGLFQFEHSHHQEIFRCIASKLKNMKEQIFREGDSLKAALSMEAGSRSPLPPSPTGSTPSILDSDICSVKPLSCFTNLDVSPTNERSFTTSDSRHISLFERHISTDRLSYRSDRRNSSDKILSSNRTLSKERSLSRERTLSSDRLSLPLISDRLSFPTSPPPTERPPPPPPKPSLNKPEKPPRKNIPPLNLELPPRLNKDAYDDVEVRSDAWKTLGTDTTPHSERPYVLPPKSNTEQMRTPETQKIFQASPTTSLEDSSDYNTLVPFGTTSKTTSPGYRQVGPAFLSIKNGNNSARDELDQNFNKKYKTNPHLDFNFVCKPNRV